MKKLVIEADFEAKKIKCFVDGAEVSPDILDSCSAGMHKYKTMSKDGKSVISAERCFGSIGLINNGVASEQAMYFDTDKDGDTMDASTAKQLSQSIHRSVETSVSASKFVKAFNKAK